jgi:hypothetical protein
VSFLLGYCFHPIRQSHRFSEQEEDTRQSDLGGDGQEDDNNDDGNDDGDDSGGGVGRRKDFEL